MACLAYVLLQTSLCCAADLEEIVRRATATLRSDWAADPKYAYVEKDETRKHDKVTSQTFQKVYIDDSDYSLLLAIDGEPLPPERQNAELEKLKREVAHRKAESPEQRRHRIAKYDKERAENEGLILDFPDAFTFELLREETVNGYPAYVLSGMPKKKRVDTSLAAKVLSGMRGTAWIDKENFHVVRVECDVMAPVPVFGVIARVLPGTHIGFDMAPVTDSIWLISDLSMDLRVSKLVFKSEESIHTTYSENRLNDLVVAELLSK
jgi:hypothetical protein